MPSPVSTIPNLGPATEAAFAKAGIHSAEELRALGPDEAYRRLLAREGRAAHPLRCDQSHYERKRPLRNRSGP